MNQKAALVLNLLLPGSGTLANKKWLTGLLQLLGAFAGFLIAGISLFSGRLVGATKYDSFLVAGCLLFAVSYIWSAIHGILFLKSSGRNPNRRSA